MHPRLGQFASNLTRGALLGLSISFQINTQWIYTPTERVGLYQVCTSNCTALPWTAADPYTASYVTRILIIIADIFMGFTFISWFKGWCSNLETLKTVLKIEGTFSIFTGLFMLIGVICFTAIAPTASNISAGWVYGYCYAVYWVLAIFWIGVGIINIYSSTSDATEEYDWCGRYKPNTCAGGEKSASVDYNSTNN
ncbi:unnamed protein product [Clavelina lepadiformis]|uniref:Uncharacterized protein n=1 Tax=Clavelina lepadiformis TaxID=159417 RepID=A0ABP0GZ19_CLALP